MTKLGLTAPNAEWRAYNLREMAAIRDLAPKVLLVPLYDVKNAATLLKRSQLALLLDDLPGTRVLYRAMAGGIPTMNPVTWAAECVTRYRFAADVARGGLIVANEMNLLVEWDGGDGRMEDWGTIGAWLMTCLSTVRAALPDVELHLPALSPVGNWLAGLGTLAGSLNLRHLYDVIDLHAYGAVGPAQVHQAADVVPGVPLSVTEFNLVQPSSFTSLPPAAVRECVWFILGGTPDQAAYDLIGSPYYDDFKQTARQPMPPTPTYSSPNHDGKRAQTLGVVLHSSRGGSASPQSEYDATVAWFDNPASQVSAHAVVGPGGQVHLSVDPDLIAWHCRARNSSWLGLEFPQAHHGDPIASDILDAAAKVVAGWQQRYGFPLRLSLTSGLCQHFETPEGIADGKTDIDAPFSANDFLARVQRIVTPAPVLNVSELTTFPDWAKARLANNQDFRQAAGLTDFVTHLKGSGRDASNPGRYGWPG